MRLYCIFNPSSGYTKIYRSHTFCAIMDKKRGEGTCSPAQIFTTGVMKASSVNSAAMMWYRWPTAALAITVPCAFIRNTWIRHLAIAPQTVGD